MLGISAVLEILLITILLIVLISLLWFFTSGTINAIAKSGTNQTQRVQEIFSTCMIVDSVNGNTVYLKNCGYGLITNDSLNIYLDGAPLTYTMTPQKIVKGGVGTISINSVDLVGISTGDHDLKITNPSAQTVQKVSISSPSVSDSLVLDLEFDEGSGTIAHDSSGHGNNGILNPNVTWTTGKSGSAVYFNGSFNYIDCGNDNSLSIGGDLTLVALIKRRGNAGNDIYTAGGVIMSKYYNYNLNIKPAGDNRLHYSHLNQSWIWNEYYTSGTIPDNQWNQIIIVRRLNGADTTVDLYINGKYDSSITNPGTPITNNYNLFIGNFQDTVSNSSWFNGTIDSVRIYNKALTPDQIGVSLKMK